MARTLRFGSTATMLQLFARILIRLPILETRLGTRSGPPQEHGLVVTLIASSIRGMAVFTHWYSVLRWLAAEDGKAAAFELRCRHVVNSPDNHQGRGSR